VTNTRGKVTIEYLWAGVNNGDIFDEPDDRLDKMLNELNKADLRVVRVWIDLRLEMDEDGEALPVGTYDDCLLEKIDELMIKAKKNGILLLITLHQYNWIQGTPLKISKEFYEWRKCKTPENVYKRSLTAGEQSVYDPYYRRGWAVNYLTNQDARDAYKRRVDHVLNHVNPYLGRAWKDINDVVWAWELQNEPEYLGDATDLKNWLDEMATHVKSMDPDTHIALGTMTPSKTLGNIQDADIYTLHVYLSPTDPVPDDSYFQEFLKEVCHPYGKLLLVEEFNVLEISPSGIMRGRTPGDPRREWRFEAIMDVCRRNQIPWMFWEYGYEYGGDDIWYENGVRVRDGTVEAYPDGIFWAAKINPAAKKIWRTPWDWTSVGKRWKVQAMAEALCSQPGADCRLDTPIFIDTFSGDQLNPGYRWFDEGTPDTWSLTQGYLEIEAGVWQDLWGGLPKKRGAPLMLRPALRGDYWVETFVRADDPSKMIINQAIPHPAQPVNTQMGLFVFKDVDNWLFFGLTNHDFTMDGTRTYGDGLIVTRTQGGASTIVAEDAIDPDLMFLRIERQEDNWRFYWKTEHVQNWALLTTVNLALTDHEVGMGVKTFDLMPPNRISGCKAFFDFFSMGASFVGNRRSLELHTPSCSWLAAMSERNRIGFSAISQALAQGYNGCWYCLRQFDTG
jgi:hypothetical protein